MTENKRFTLHKWLDTLNIMDNTKFNEHIYINKSSKDMELLVGVLNAQHEEIMQLKSEKVELLEENITYKNAWLGLKDERDEQCVEIKEYEQLITELNDIKNKYKKVNEQLKATIKEVIELLSDEVDVFSDKATEHDIIAYRELNQLDNKDAYYMATATKKAIKMLKGDVCE